MKLRVLFLLAATSLVFAFSACSKEEVKKTVAEAVEMDLNNVIGTWEGTYTPAITETSATELGEIEVKAVDGDKKALIVDSKVIKAIKVKITANAISALTAEAEANDVIESGSFGYIKSNEGGKITFTIKVKKGSEPKSFVFTSSKKK